MRSRSSTRRRIRDGGNLATRKELKRDVVKLVLLIVRETNPLEHLSQEEKAILMGVDRRTFAKIEGEKRFFAHRQLLSSPFYDNRSAFGGQMTEEILEMARERLLGGDNLAPRGCDKRKVKLALLLVIEANPVEILSREEAAILYGTTSKTMREGKLAIPRPVNM